MQTKKQPKGIQYPDFDILQYQISLIRNLDFYNKEIDDYKKKKQWAIEYWQSEHKNTSKISRLSDGYFVTAGAIAHMLLHRQLSLLDDTRAYMMKRFEELHQYVKLKSHEDVIEVSAVVETSIKPVNDDEYVRHLEEFELVLDGNLDLTFDVKNYLLSNQVKPPHIKKVINVLNDKLSELEDVYTTNDEQLLEAYSYLSKSQFNKLVKLIKSMIEDCTNVIGLAKIEKNKKQKSKPASEIVKNVKYMIEDTTIQLQSEHPVKIINSSEVWVYNSKIRRLIKYIAKRCSKLSIKGCTIINFDEKKSCGKIIRKPSEQLANVKTMSSLDLKIMFDCISGSESKVAGRISEDIVIIKTF